MTIRSTIEQWISGVKEDLLAQYDRDGRRASGNWARELEGNVIETDKGYRVTILGAYYTFWMENGRRPGRFPPISAIRKWIDDKGIIAGSISKDSLAFLIARKIAREGYKGKPTTGAVITNERIDNLIRQVGMFLVEKTSSDIIKAFKENGSN